MSRGFTFEHTIYLDEHRVTSSTEGKRRSLEILRSHLDNDSTEYEYHFEYKKPNFRNFKYGRNR